MRYKVSLRQKRTPDRLAEVMVSAPSQKEALQRGIRKITAETSSSVTSILHDIEWEALSAIETREADQLIRPRTIKYLLLAGLSAFAILGLLNMIGLKWTGWVILALLGILGYIAALWLSSKARFWFLRGPYLSKAWFLLLLGLLAGLYWVLGMVGAIVD